LSRKAAIRWIPGIVVVAILLLVFLNRRNTGVPISGIVLQDPDRIDGIFLSDPYDSVHLEKINGRWTLEGEEEAYLLAVENLLYAASRLEIGSVFDALPEGASEQQRMVRFMKQDKEVLSYRVYPHRDRLLLGPEGSDKVYSMTLPGYQDLDLGTVYSVHVNHYREHVLIDLLPSEIRFLEVERQGESAFRFEMDHKGDIRGLVRKEGIWVAADSLEDLSVRLLFSYFTNIRFERKLESRSDAARASLVPQRYLGRLFVGAVSGETYQLEIYSMPGTEEDETHMHQALVKYNSAPDPLVVNYIFLDVLMRPLGHYYVDKQDI
jgi:hypothetical protein